MSWIERAKVGDKVVCVCIDECGDREPFEVWPVNGVVYTIRDLESDGEDVFAMFVEITNRPTQYDSGDFGEAQFDLVCFKPVRDTTLQVEAIKRAALDVPAKSPETVA